MQYTDMWQSVKVVAIKSEKMNWKVSGYIVGNLLKHKEVSNFEELYQNKFSSYWYLVNKYGEEEIRNLVYGVIDVGEDNWNNTDMLQLNSVNL